MSHPSWVCGLKQQNEWSLNKLMRHTLRGCVDWNKSDATDFPIPEVTPFVGVWIETWAATRHWMQEWVTPFVGVWIETLIGGLFGKHNSHTLRGCVDWNTQSYWVQKTEMSHPSWVCGLKLFGSSSFDANDSHTLRGCVDWNNLQILLLLILLGHTLRGCVDWNPRVLDKFPQRSCHTLRGCVDWNGFIHTTKGTY